jgi:hypothetical protein
MYIKLECVLLFSALVILNAFIGHGIAVGMANSLVQAFLLCQAMPSDPVITNHA